MQKRASRVPGLQLAKPLPLPDVPPPPPEDPLLEAELAAGSVFGAHVYVLALKVPPSLRGPGGLVTAKRPIDSPAGDALLSRAKRPKAVKFSPSKANKRAARVVAAGGPAELGRVFEADTPLPNHDFCEACGAKGHFLCCDGCPRSFHFNCLDPPLELDQLPTDSWFCKVCRAEERPNQRPPPGLFGQLIHNANTTNVKEFRLPEPLRNSFKNITSSAFGEFIDQSGHKAPKVNARGFIELADPYKLKDKNGIPIQCFKCDLAASQAQGKRIVACDYCDQHWHLDCLDPPLPGLPSSTRKWMCPLHSEHVAPKIRRPKPQPVVTVTDRNIANNGNIQILPRPAITKAEPNWDELMLNGVRYQVPEETLILDFWAKVRGTGDNLTARMRMRNKLAKQLGVPVDGNESESSGLSSLESTPEPPDRLSPQPPADAVLVVRQVSTSHLPLPPEDRQASATPSLQSSDVDTAPSAADLLKKVRRRNGIPEPGLKVNGIRESADDQGGSPLKVRLALPTLRPTKPRPSRMRGRARGAAGTVLASQDVNGSQSATLAASSTGNDMSIDAPPQSSSSNQFPRRPSPLNNDSSISQPEIQRPASRSASFSSTGPPKPLEVHSPEDLKALSHVRKLMKDQNYSSQGDNLLEFVAAESPPVPVLGYLEATAKDPWTLPWNDAST